MSKPEHNLKIDYIELPGKQLPDMKAFYKKAFDWDFTDYGDEYASFTDGRLDGGINTYTPVVSGGVLVVLFANDIADAEKRVIEAGGIISTPTFEFPGGRRFHFKDPAGNELAVWAF